MNSQTFRKSELFNVNSVEISLNSSNNIFKNSLSSISSWNSSISRSVSITIDVLKMKLIDNTSDPLVNLTATDLNSGSSIPISFDIDRNLYAIDISNLVCKFAPSLIYQYNDAM